MSENYPHVCPSCGGEAYVGLSLVECSTKGCRHYIMPDVAAPSVCSIDLGAELRPRGIKDFTLASDSRLDAWGRYFGVARHPGETDAELRSRVLGLWSSRPPQACID